MSLHPFDDRLVALKPQTNGDSVRAMTDEEFADFIFRDPAHLYMKTPKETLAWLKSPADKEETK